MTSRKGESEAGHPRTDRFFCICGKWYFSSRENLQIGPFNSREDAESELMTFLRHIRQENLFAQRYYAAAFNP